MLQRWKLILANWINCYFNDEKKQQNVNLQSLLSIISKLRENLNLDESKSALLAATTLDDFIYEKYPEFKFENGTVEAGNEDEICLSASLLLFFVCVNSKNFDVKNAMCSKLSSEDQETILKFSKTLLECPEITVREVQGAITEACGQDIAAMELPRPSKVSETPPVLRSMHSEVRRLQAALDAERFDRNYLQEELQRTHSRLERLLQEKEQHKLDILQLKAKISLCCGEEAESKNAEAAADTSAKLTRHLQQLEANLEETQVLLNDATYERDSYKAKIDKLKQDRDKWLALSQEENARVAMISDELDSERQNVQSLKELVAELQQHNKLNMLDSSSLECDDPNASIQSLLHNTSVCSEACANVVEVQLVEERAKIVVLKEQIQTLQDQINELNNKFEKEKNSLENTVAQKENDIFNLRHRINEEIEQRTNLKSYCDNEMTKLNNEINELEQKLKDSNEHSRSVIEKKMGEIQILQEEKLSLLHSLNNETTKLENKIKDLQSELDAEKQARSQMKEGYENHIMKLNEKVLNRNNELVELQNSIFERGEKIETLQIELRNEKEALIEIRHNYQMLSEEKIIIETDLRQKCDEIQDLHEKIQHCNTVIEELNLKTEQQKASNNVLNESCKALENVKEDLLREILNRDAKIEETLININHINEVFANEKDKLSQDIDERNATVYSLQSQLQNEIEFKVGLQHEITQLQTENNHITQELNKINSVLSTLKTEMEDKDKAIDAMDLFISDLKSSNYQANEKIISITNDITNKEKDIISLNKKLENMKEHNEQNAEVANTNLLAAIKERETLESQMKALVAEKAQLEKRLSEKSSEAVELQKSCQEFEQKLKENALVIQLLEHKYNNACIKYDDLASEMQIINDKVKKMHDAITEWAKVMNIKIIQKESILKKMSNDMVIIKNIYDNTTISLQNEQEKVKVLNSKLNGEINYKNDLEEKYKLLVSKLDIISSEKQEEIMEKNEAVKCLNLKIQSLSKAVDLRAECMKSLEERLNNEIQIKDELSRQKMVELKDLKNKIEEIKFTNDDLKYKASMTVKEKLQMIDLLRKQIDRLHFSVEQNTNNLKSDISHKDLVIENLEQQVKDYLVKLEDLRKAKEDSKIFWDRYKTNASAALLEKEDTNTQLKQSIQNFELQVSIMNQEKLELTKLNTEIVTKFEETISKEKAIKGSLESENEKVIEEKQVILSENKSLLEEKSILSQQLAEERSVKSIVEEEKNIVQNENVQIKQELSYLCKEIECLAQQLIEEKAAKEIIEKEIQILVSDKESLLKKLIENEQAMARSCQENCELKRQIEFLHQDLSKHTEDLSHLNIEIKNTNEKVVEQESINEGRLQDNKKLLLQNDQLAQEIDCLTIALKEKTNMETENNNIVAKFELQLIQKEEELNSQQEKIEILTEKYEDMFKEKERLLMYLNDTQNVLKAEKDYLEKALSNEKANCDQIQSENNALAVKLELELKKREEENKTLLTEIYDLKLALNDEKLLKDQIIKEKDFIVLEKVSIVSSLEIEKGAKDALESEKNTLLVELENLKVKLHECESTCDKYAKDIADHEEVINDLTSSSNELQAINQEFQDALKEISTSVCETYSKLCQKIEEGHISSTFLCKLRKPDNLTEQPIAKCYETIFDLADILMTELAQSQKTLKENDTEIFDKKTEINRLQQVINENNIELSKQSQNHTTSMNSKISDIQTLQEENKKLRNELNGLRVKLEVKVHSLKEKLVDNEDLTDKLKATYECQIESLNVMVKKLTAYLKEKTVEMESISKTGNEKFNKLLQRVQDKDITNELLRKLVEENKLKDMSVAESYDLILNTAEVLLSEVTRLDNVEATLNNKDVEISELQAVIRQKDTENLEKETEIKRMEQLLNESEVERNKHSETNAMSLNSQRDVIATLRQENKKLDSKLSNTKKELEIQINISKEQFSDSKNLTEKLKSTYQSQINNLNDMITKLTNYLKEKTAEVETLRMDKNVLQQTVVDSCQVIKTLEEDLKTEKINANKLNLDFESERQILQNMVTVTESVMEDLKISSSNTIAEHVATKESLKTDIIELNNVIEDLRKKHRAEEATNEALLSLLRLERQIKQDVEFESEYVRDYLDEIIGNLSKERNTNISVISALEFQEKVLFGDYEKIKNEYDAMKKANHGFKIAVTYLENELKSKDDIVEKVKQEKSHMENELKTQTEKLAQILEEKVLVEKTLQEKIHDITVMQLELKSLNRRINDLCNEKSVLDIEKKENQAKLEEYRTKIDTERNEFAKLKDENQQLLTMIDENKTVIENLEQLIKHELEENHKIREDKEQEKLMSANKYTMLEEHYEKIEKELKDRQIVIDTLKQEIETFKSTVEICEQDCKAKDGIISKMSKEKDAVINTITKELVEEKAAREKIEKELQMQKSVVSELKNKLEITVLKKENEHLIRAIGQQETFTALSQEKGVEKYQVNRDHYQVDNSCDSQSSVESLKTIADLEKIVNDKNRTITNLQTDITYLKTLLAESETKLLDVNKELQVTKENCQQLSVQLKKIVFQKNEDIAELKKQVTKMSVTENRATQIIKVSAKYQAMILKRIAEIKSNTVLKELTNFGNSSNENELRRSLNAGTITMEDLENFLETTDRHLKRCSEKQIILTKEKDRLTEVNRINESEIINLKKFLTELSVSFQTFNSIKELYGNKLSKIISVQRTVRREILSLDGRVTDAVMCKLERGYGAAMQDLSECVMNLERWVERCISRTVSVEKIKQAFTSDSERSSLASPSFQNTGLEIQLQELDKSFQKLLEEVARAVKGEGAKESQASTVMEVRAEYEDKLNRMKAKMKDLFNEQMAVLKNKQREELALLERELKKSRDHMAESKRAYESHIKDLTKELWNVGEKYLVKNDEAEWLRKKQLSGSLMSLQHVHSSGLVPQEIPSRPSDATSLRSLPISDNQHKKKNDRGMHMSDEEGEVFDNRWLKELESTPRASRGNQGQRLSELRWRNSLCPPHLRSCYPTETQFTAVADEEDVKVSASLGRTQRKEVGITAYKKPGPPTPSKQAGRLSATDSELRESLRVDADPHHSDRKMSTPARFRALLRFNKHDSTEGTPRTRRLSNLFRKK